MITLGGRHHWGHTKSCEQRKKPGEQRSPGSGKCNGGANAPAVAGKRGRGEQRSQEKRKLRLKLKQGNLGGAATSDQFVRETKKGKQRFRQKTGRWRDRIKTDNAQQAQERGAKRRPGQHSAKSAKDLWEHIRAPTQTHLGNAGVA